MYPVEVTWEGSQVIITDTDRGTPTLGFRVTVELADGQTAAEAYAGLELTAHLNTTNGIVLESGGTQTFSGDQAYPVRDASVYHLPSSGALYLTGGSLGQQYTVWVLELQDDEILPDGASGSGGGTPVTPEVTDTLEEGIDSHDGGIPALSTEGADLAGATAVELTVYDEEVDTTLAPAGILLAWIYALGSWIRCPELDIDASGIPAGQAAVTFQEIALALGGTTDDAERIAWRPLGMNTSGPDDLLSLLYRVTTPQSPGQTLDDTTSGSLGLDDAATNPPTSPTDGVDLEAVDGVQVGVAAPGGSTIDQAGSLAAYILPEGTSVWTRAPDWDLPVGALGTYTGASPQGTRQNLWWAPRFVKVPAGRLCYRPSGMALTGGGTSVVVVYRTAQVTATVVNSPVTEADLATPDGAVPTTATEGVSLADTSALRVTVQSSNGTDTIDAAGGLAAYLYVQIGLIFVWTRAPAYDLAIAQGGEVGLTFGDLAVLVPAGRLAYRPSGMALTPPGGTVDVTYQTAAD